MKCAFCNVEHDLKNEDISYHDDLNKSVNKNLPLLCNYSNNKLNVLIQKLSKRGLNFNESFENYIGFIESEIDIRIESLKIEIDRLKEKLLKKIDHLHEEFNIKHSALNEIVETKLNKAYIKQLKKLSAKIINFDKNNFKIKTNFLCASDSIGLLKGPFINIKKLECAEPTIVDLRYKVQSLCALCALTDKKILISDFKRNEIYVFNLNFNAFERINFVQGIKIRSYYGLCASDDFENIYLCDLEYSRILISNNNFSLIKKIILKAGTTINEFCCARDICFHSDCLFVLDQGYKSVFIYNKHGEFIKMFDLIKDNKTCDKLKQELLIQNPMCISAADDIIAIMDWKKSIYFYNFQGSLVNSIEVPEITSFCLKYDYLLTHGENGIVACYVKTSEYAFNKVSEVFFEKLMYRSESMILLNDKLIISMGWSKILAVIIVT